MIQKISFICKHCDEEFDCGILEMMKHEKTCFKNPEAKLCHTCIYGVMSQCPEDDSMEARMAKIPRPAWIIRENIKNKYI